MKTVKHFTAKNSFAFIYNVFYPYSRIESFKILTREAKLESLSGFILVYLTNNSDSFSDCPLLILRKSILKVKVNSSFFLCV